MYRISKDFHFCAAHHVPTLEDGNPCKRVHGHNYLVRLELCGHTLGEEGFLRDLKQLAPFRELLDTEFDHRMLNDHPWFKGTAPTTEHLAFMLWTWARSRWPEVCAVRISETPKTWISYEGGEL